MLKIKKKDWENYINALAGVSERAAKDMQDFVDKNGMEDVTTIIAKSYQCSVKYGEAAMALTCEMYDKIAVVQGAKVPPAVPARSVTMQEVKDTVNHALRTAPSTVPAVAGKLVKKSSSRTMRKNAARDGARMALVPSGDGCPFCKMLGSRGWEPARSKRSKTFEAHLHAHCRCEYVVDFTGDMQVEGYDPDALYDEFMSLDGTSWEERMNIMRNQQRKIPAIRDKINAQKRVAYELNKSGNVLRKSITLDTFDELKSLVGPGSKYNISNDVIDCISRRLMERGFLDAFESIRIKKLERGKLFDTVMTIRGTWYKCELHINGALLQGKTLKEVQSLIQNNKMTVCKSLEECVDHEIVHAKQAHGAMASVVDKWNDHEGITSISEVASEDMLETLAEVDVLKRRDEYDRIKLSEEDKRLIDEAEKEFGL